VDITESPQKEHLIASAPRVVVPTASNQMTPNCHRRLQTLPRRFVTPITPHHMNIDIKNKLTNGAVLIISTILKHVMSSVAKAEIGSVFLKAKEATILRTTLE
jgi:hypothetical protein